MTATPREVIYSALTRDAGFKRWATAFYTPRTAAAERLVRTIRNDPKFPEHLDDRERFMFWLRYGPRLPYHVRREAAPLWASYARWRRARTAREVQAREADEPAVPVSAVHGPAAAAQRKALGITPDEFEAAAPEALSGRGESVTRLRLGS